ncbi:MAG TPA: PIN domain-containing protein [Chloroflexi bacterium]|nr:PIN domain-containing protein [Chloroflexota bacterium]
MILLDTNVFVIDRFFHRDERYEVNKRFITALSEIEAGFCIFSLFELCGISSFNLSLQELKRWSYYFDEGYAIEILEPQELYTATAADWFANFSAKMFELFGRKMTWGDAVLLKTAEEYEVDAIVTWNKKHFEGRTTIEVLTPEEYLER